MISLGYPIGQCLEMCIRLIVACACGALIGYERERKYKDAGLRTHVIVCCSSALMMIVSKYGFSDLYAAGDYLFGTKGVDPSRVAAQVISGVSFIGAGVIFHNKNNTKGLTTASGLWAIAGVGIAIGAGMYEVGIFATILIAIVHTIIQRIPSHHQVQTMVNIGIVANNTEDIRERIQKYIEENAIGLIEQNVKIDDNRIEYNMTVKMESEPSTEDVNELFEDDDDIKSVSVSIVG